MNIYLPTNFKAARRYFCISSEHVSRCTNYSCRLITWHWQRNKLVLALALHGGNDQTDVVDTYKCLRVYVYDYYCHQRMLSHRGTSRDLTTGRSMFIHQLRSIIIDFYARSSAVSTRTLLLLSFCAPASTSSYRLSFTGLRASPADGSGTAIRAVAAACALHGLLLDGARHVTASLSFPAGCNGLPHARGRAKGRL